MRRVLPALVVIPFIAVLTACAPAVHTGASGPSQPSVSGVPVSTPSATPVVTPTPTPTAPPVINPADYLVDGNPHHPDANDEWFGEYAFWTDATKSVICEETIFSGDNPGTSCTVVPSARAQVTYPLPPGSSPNCAKSDWDGYTIGLGASVDDLIPKDAGFDQCWDPSYYTPAILAKTKVLPDGATLAVAPFKCTVKASVASCEESAPGYAPATFSFGLHVATFHSS